MPDLASVNGKVTPLRRASVPLQDRGFLLGDGVYEVLRTYGGRIFEFDAHIDRLEASLRGARIRMPTARRALRLHIDALLTRSGYSEGRIYIQVTRGVAPRQHAFPSAVRPTLVIYVERIPTALRDSKKPGMTAITVADLRWGRCDLKCIGLLANVLAKQAALEAGADEAIFVGHDGTVHEGSTANVFIVRGSTIHTHPLDTTILPGVSRALALEVAREAELTVREVRFRTPALYLADEVFVSSTMAEIRSVVRIDGRRIGNGRTGPVTRELARRFHARALGVGSERRPPRRSIRRRSR